ncbi:unnamed protein product [Sphagnum jensenii]|uniref:Uncharacterized protein n=1 Tax=Sphagnum jensenii TaxID=128206 RepID=A0ABP1BJ09_9BRYO
MWVAMARTRAAGVLWAFLVVLLLCLLTSPVHVMGKLDPHYANNEWKKLENMEKVLAGAAHLPLHSQKLILKAMGDSISSFGEGRCNIFGGSSSCVAIPSDSDYLKQCPDANKKVDCALRMAAFEHIAKDPEIHFQEKMSSEGFPECADCYKLLHQFWCAQTVPSCGIFDKVIDEILPLISAVTLKKEKASVALQEAVPRMLQAASLGLPCREMCDAITHTCGCDKPTTFGQAMMSMQTGKHQNMYNVNMSVSTAKDIFAKVWDEPVCELFVESGMPGFTGVCTVQESADSCSWCSGKSPRPGIVDEQIVAQTAQWFSGLMQGGLEEILMSAGGEQAKTAAFWSWNQNGEVSKKKSSGGHSIVWVILLILVFVAALAFVTAVKVHQSRRGLSQYLDLNSMGYTPPIL